MANKTYSRTQLEAYHTALLDYINDRIRELGGNPDDDEAWDELDFDIGGGQGQPEVVAMNASGPQIAADPDNQPDDEWEAIRRRNLRAMMGDDGDGQPADASDELDFGADLEELGDEGLEVVEMPDTATSREWNTLIPAGEAQASASVEDELPELDDELLESGGDLDYGQAAGQEDEPAGEWDDLLADSPADAGGGVEPLRGEFADEPEAFAFEEDGEGEALEDAEETGDDLDGFSFDEDDEGEALDETEESGDDLDGFGFDEEVEGEALDELPLDEADDLDGLAFEEEAGDEDQDGQPGDGDFAGLANRYPYAAEQAAEQEEAFPFDDDVEEAAPAFEPPTPAAPAPAAKPAEQMSLFDSLFDTGGAEAEESDPAADMFGEGDDPLSGGDLWDEEDAGDEF